MEIHKPHAAKTWREFTVELATITAGILTALTLEQVIEQRTRIRTEEAVPKLSSLASVCPIKPSFE